jgi:predicted alpha/beta-hydrolase family hydrolase
MPFIEFSDTIEDPPVRGFLHAPESASAGSLVLTHGAGGNADMALLVALAETFAGAGFAVLRCDLPFRQLRRFGPPRSGDAKQDQKGLRNAVLAMREKFPGNIYLGGQSYGGRQASMLLAEDGSIVDGLLLLSYPLHPPNQPEKLRTRHLPKLTTPTMFVEGTKDPFGTITEIEDARKLIPAKTKLVTIEGVGHDLGFKGKKGGHLPGVVLESFLKFFVGKKV